MITQTNRYQDFVDSLKRKAADLGGDRAMNTPKQRQQASSSRCVRNNLLSAVAACQAMADAVERGDFPAELECFKSMKSICEATELRTSSGTNYYSESYLVHDDYRDTSEPAKKLRAWLERGATAETEADKQERERKHSLEQALSAVRGANIEGFFPTPDEVIECMLTGVIDVKGKLVLEPSAGIGSICDMVRSRGGEVVAVERMSSLCKILELKGHQVIHEDFLTLEPEPIFDFVLMNPPFEKNAAPAHVLRAYQWLKPGGALRAVMPNTAMRYADSNNRKLQEFANWVDTTDHGGWWYELPEGAFKSSFRPTGANCVVLTMTA